MGDSTCSAQPAHLSIEPDATMSDKPSRLSIEPDAIMSDKPSTPITQNLATRQRPALDKSSPFITTSPLDRANDDTYQSILMHVEFQDLPNLRLVSSRWAKLVKAVWPAICTEHFPLPGMTGQRRANGHEDPFWAFTPSLLWAMSAVDGYDRHLIGECIFRLIHLDMSWPGCVKANPGANNRLLQLRNLPPRLKLPADVAFFMVLGIEIEAASPIGPISGDFGPEYAEETPREPWRISLMWPELGEDFLPYASSAEVSDAAEAAEAAANVINAAQEAAAAPSQQDDEGEHAMAADFFAPSPGDPPPGPAAAAVADPEGGGEGDAEDQEQEVIVQNSVGAYAAALARSRDMSLHAPQTLLDYGTYMEHPIGEGDNAMDRIYQDNSGSMLLCGNFALSASAGAHLPLYINCDPEAIGTSEYGGLHGVVFDSLGQVAGMDDEEFLGTLDYRFPFRKDNQAMTLTDLLADMNKVLLGSELRYEMRKRLESGEGPPDMDSHMPRSLDWGQLWQMTDLYGGITERLDAPEDDIASSIVDDMGEEGDDDGEEEGDDEEEEDDDEYPASMLGEEEDPAAAVALDEDPAIVGEFDEDPAAFES